MRNVVYLRDNLVAVGGKTGVLSIWDIATLKLLRKTQYLKQDVIWLQASSDKSLLIAGDSEGNLVTIDVIEDRLLYSHSFATDQGIETSFLPNQRDFIIACEGDIFLCADSSIIQIGSHSDYPIHIATAYEGKRLIVGDNVGEVLVYNLDRLKIINGTQISSYPIQFVGSINATQAIVVDGEYIHILDLDNMSTKLIREVENRHSSHVTSVDIMAKKNRMAACTTTGALLVSDYTKDSVLQSYIVDSAKAYTGVTFTNTASKFALSDYYGNLTVWDVEDNIALHLSEED